LWEGRMIGRQARPCMNLFVMIDDSAWFLKSWMCCSRSFFLVIFGAFSWRFSWSDFEAFLFGILWGVYAWALRGSFPFDSPPKSVSKGARFWGFRCSRVRGVLGGISLIPLNLASFGGQNLGYGVPMRCFYCPQSLVQIRGAIREIGSWIWGCWPAGVVHPDELRSHRSDRCLSPFWPVWTLVEFCSGERLSEVAVVPCLWQPTQENTVLSPKTNLLWSLSNSKVSSCR
jgi:hypothetical protein